MELICNTTPNLRLGYRAFAWSMKAKMMDHGIGNTDSLIADTYHVLFVNYFCDTYVFDTLDKLRSRKDLYRFELKKHINEGIRFIHHYEQRLFLRMGWDYSEKFGNMNNNLQDAFQKDLDRLEQQLITTYREKNSREPELFARIQLSIMLLELSKVNTEDRINENLAINPAASNIKWTDHSNLHKTLLAIDGLLKCEDVSKDLIVRDRWIKLQKKWYNVDFIADNMGDKVFGDNEETKELRTIIKQNS